MAEFLDFVWTVFSCIGAALVLFLAWATWMVYLGRADFFIGAIKPDDSDEHLGV